jgi:hypothetical protein
LRVRPLLAWFNNDARKREMFAWVAQSCRESRHELEDALRGSTLRAEVDDTQSGEPAIRPYPKLKGLRPEGRFFRDERGEPLLILSVHSPSQVLQRFFASPLQHIESYSVGGGSRWTIDESPVYKVFQQDPDAHRVGWDGWCGHLVRDLDSMGGTKKENVVICLESPRIREAVAQYIRDNIPRMHRNPQLLYDIMAYELTYICYCERSQHAFREWLERHFVRVLPRRGGAPGEISAPARRHEPRPLVRLGAFQSGSLHGLSAVGARTDPRPRRNGPPRRRRQLQHVGRPHGHQRH